MGRLSSLSVLHDVVDDNKPEYYLLFNITNYNIKHGLMFLVLLETFLRFRGVSFNFFIENNRS